MLPLSQIVQLLGFVVLLSTGQILFKKAALSAPALGSVQGIMALAFNAWFWLALVLYGVATLLWIIILQKIKLSVAYPFSAFGFILVPMAASFLFGENLSPWYAVGVVLIVAGVVLVSMRA